MAPCLLSVLVCALLACASSSGTTRVSGSPFNGAAMYVNPDYASNVVKSMTQTAAGSMNAQLIAKAKRFPTAVWLDSIAAVAGGVANNGLLGLTAHLDAAVAQAAAALQPVIVTLVIYNLPCRDCAALASNGLLQGLSGLATYKSKYIDVIHAALTSKPAYASLRFALIIEPDSLPNMVTNMGVPACASVAQQGLYVSGVTYAVQAFSKLANTYIYLDIAHSGWLGWTGNMEAAVAFYTQVIKGFKGGDLSVIRGFATDISNYTPLLEPYLKPTNLTVLGDAFYQWNPTFDELTYVKSLALRFQAEGFTNFGFLIDTSRSGWKVVNNGKPIDQRSSRGNWCNVIGAGLGARPQASPSAFSMLDAYVYVKPPGESDGADPATMSNITNTGGKKFDPHCSSANPALNAMPEAPLAGSWFFEQFLTLLQHATPPL